MNYHHQERHPLDENKFQRKNASFRRIGAFSMKSLVTFLSIAMLFSTTLADELKVLHEEELVSDLHLNAKERMHYHMRVTDRIYKGDDHLTISAFATSYDSDPDIYISKVSQTLLSRRGNNSCICVL